MKRAAGVRSSWLDSVDPSSITEEHVLLMYGLKNKPCPLGKCRQNCRSNPLCLNGLGEAKWLEAPPTAPPKEETDQDSPKAAHERSDDVVGLVNYGNTCYLNSFLQLYYRMTDLRQAVYNTPEDASAEEESQGARTVIGELKMIFAQLQAGVHSPVEPAGLVNALGLQLQEPQDAPEFHSLFMTFLERHMSPPASSAVIRSLLEGSFTHTNCCLTCGYTSSQSATFLELALELSEMCQLSQSIAQSLQPESLTGDNQYSCPVCNAKCDGERRARLTRLPPLLCFHLLRFTYDRKRGCKRKSKLRVQIPARLDMEPFVEGGGPEGRWRYVLKGILIHLGPQPFSGHYVAVVRDYRLGWIVCNDEQTQRVKSLNLARLESEALRTRPGGSPARGGGGAGGGLEASGERERVHESRNAYMLLYEQQDRFEVRASPETKYKVELPPALKERVEAQNRSMRDGWHAAARNRSVARERDAARHLRMGQLVRKLYARDPPELFNGPGMAPPEIKVESDPGADRLKTEESDSSEVKEEKAAEKEEFKPEAEAEAEAAEVAVPCSDGEQGCSSVAGSLLTKNGPGSQPGDDGSSQGAPELSPNRIGSPACPMEEREEFVPTDWLVRCLRSQASAANGSAAQPAANSGDAEQNEGLCPAALEWADRLLCPHGRLRPDTAPERVKLVPSEVVEELLGPDLSASCRRMKRSSALCLPCVRLHCILHQFNSQAADLSRLIEQWKKNPAASELAASPLVWIGRSSLTRWKTAAKAALNASCTGEPITGEEQSSEQQQPMASEEASEEQPVEEEEEAGFLFNSDLLCRHRGLTLDESKRRLFPLPLFRRIVALFPEPVRSSMPSFSAEAAPCEACCHERHQQELGVTEQRDKLSDLLATRKNRAGVAPRRLTPPQDYWLVPNEFLARWRKYLRQPSPELQPKELATSAVLCPHGLLGQPLQELVIESKATLTPVSEEEWLVFRHFYRLEGPPLRATWFGDAEGWRSQPGLCGECFADLASEREQYRDATIHIRKVEAPGKEEEGEREEEAEPEPSPEPPNKMARLCGTRRSGRQRRLASDRAVRVSSDWSLRRLKVELMSMFAAAPFDQHIMLPDYTELTLPECSLQTLGIRPGDLLLLWTEEATVNCFTDCSNDDAAKASAEETGFRGTKLMTG